MTILSSMLREGVTEIHARLGSEVARLGDSDFYQAIKRGRYWARIQHAATKLDQGDISALRAYERLWRDAVAAQVELEGRVAA